MALEDAGGVVARAARLLRLSARQNLQYMLKNPHKNLRNITTSITEQDVIPNETTSGQKTEVPQQTSKAIRILHVEDDLTVAGLVQEMAAHEGWTIKHSVEGNAALDELASDADYDLLVVDHDLPGLNGVELMEQVRSMLHRRYMPIVMMSGRLDEATAREAGETHFCVNRRVLVRSSRPLLAYLKGARMSGDGFDSRGVGTRSGRASFAVGRGRQARGRTKGNAGRCRVVKRGVTSSRTGLLGTLGGA